VLVGADSGAGVMVWALMGRSSRMRVEGSAWERKSVSVGRLRQEPDRASVRAWGLK
jgi:hypothetical protein